jgi:hypothetical protein
MRKLAIATTAIALILGAGAASADQNRGWNTQSDRQTAHRQVDRRAAVPRHARGVEVVKVGLHRRYFDETIPLRRLLNLDRDYRGYRIQSVVVKVRPQKSRGRLALVANGHVVDRARSGQTRRIELTPDGDRTLGRDLRRLQLNVRGRAFIDSIQVKLRPPRHQRRGWDVHRTSHDHGDKRDRNPELAEQIVRIILGQVEVSGERY